MGSSNSSLHCSPEIGSYRPPPCQRTSDNNVLHHDSIQLIKLAQSFLVLPFKAEGPSVLNPPGPVSPALTT